MVYKHNKEHSTQERFSSSRGRSFQKNSLNRGGTVNKKKEERIQRGKMRTVRFEMPAGEKIEYKNLSLLGKFLTERGKILSRRVTGITAKEQRAVATAIKRARYLSLLPVGSTRK